MCSFLEMVQLTSFCIYKSMRIINSKYSCACLVWRKVIEPKPDLPECSLKQCDVWILTTKWLSWILTTKWLSSRYSVEICIMHQNSHKTSAGVMWHPKLWPTLIHKTHSYSVAIHFSAMQAVHCREMSMIHVHHWSSRLELQFQQCDYK